MKIQELLRQKISERRNYLAYSKFLDEKRDALAKKIGKEFCRIAGKKSEEICYSEKFQKLQKKIRKNAKDRKSADKSLKSMKREIKDIAKSAYNRRDSYPRDPFDSFFI
jgi:seryl-tRNA synthetase